jgi:prevent-host-death family protein
MMAIGIRELKNKLSQILRITKNGEKIIILERGKPIATIQPINKIEKVPNLDIILSRLSLEDMIRLPQKKLLKKIPSIEINGESVEKAVIEDRK